MTGVLQRRRLPNVVVDDGARRVERRELRLQQDEDLGGHGVGGRLAPPTGGGGQQARLSVLEPLVADAGDVDLVLVEEARLDAAPPVDDGAEAARTLVLQLRVRVGQVAADVGALDVHVAHADHTAVEVVVLVEVEDRVGQRHVHHQAVRLGQRGPRQGGDTVHRAEVLVEVRRRVRGGRLQLVADGGAWGA